MMMVLKKKQLIVIGLAILLAAIGYFNFSAFNGDDEPNLASSTYLGEAQLVDNVETRDGKSDFFDQARLDREAGRSKSIETFNALISNPNSDASAKEAAQQGVLELAENTETESGIENMIRAKGYEDAVCYINNNSASVVVKAQSLTPADSLIISEIVSEQSKIPMDKIKIVEIQ